MLPAIRFVLGSTQMVISLHGLAIVVGVAAGARLAVRRARDPGAILGVVAVIAVTALAGAHGLFVLLHGASRGGLASMGGIAAGIAATWVVARLCQRSGAELLDAVVPAGLLALGIGRVGCFLAGCCYGGPTTLPWGIVFPELGPAARHPLQLYSAAADLGLVAVLPPRASAPGVVAARACVGFGIARAALECVRDPAATEPLLHGVTTLPQAAALLLAASAALICTRLRPHAPSTMPPARRTAARWPMRKR
jgi:phosphatidylglycerol---prolipoprotein diacylglyceryl transferase